MKISVLRFCKMLNLLAMQQTYLVTYANINQFIC